MAFCKYCGCSVPDKAEFCPECGKKISVTIDPARSVTTDDVPSRRDFFSVMGSPDAKKRIRRNWIVLAAAVLLRIATICVLVALQFPRISEEIRMWYISRLVINPVSLYLLLLLLACVFKRRGMAIAAVVLSVYFALPINGWYTIWDAALGVAELALAVVVMHNTNKLEKEYQSYLGQAFPGSGKKK